MHAAFGQAIAQARQKRGKPGFRGPVHIVGRAPAVAGDRTYPHKRSFAASFEAFGKRAHQQRRSRVVRSHDQLGGGDRALAFPLVSEHSDNAYGGAGQRLEAARERGAAPGVENVKDMFGHARARSYPQIPRLAAKPAAVARRQLERPSVPRERRRDGAPDVGSRPDHQRRSFRRRRHVAAALRAVVHNASRRDSADAKRVRADVSSRAARNASRCGYP